MERVSPTGSRRSRLCDRDCSLLQIVDVATKKVTETLAANVNGANRLKFTPDGTLVLVSTLGGSDLSIIDAATRRETKRVTIGRGAGWNSDATRLESLCGVLAGRLRRRHRLEVAGGDRAD